MWTRFHGKWTVTIDSQLHTIEASVYYMLFWDELYVTIDDKMVYEANVRQRTRKGLFALDNTVGRFQRCGHEFVIATEGVMFSRDLMLFIDGRNIGRGSVV